MIEHYKVHRMGVHFRHKALSKLFSFFCKSHHFLAFQFYFINLTTTAQLFLHSLGIFFHGIKLRLRQRCTKAIPKKKELRLQLHRLHNLIRVHDEFLNLHKHCFHILNFNNDNSANWQTQLQSIIFIVSVFTGKNDCYAIFRIFRKKVFHRH